MQAAPGGSPPPEGDPERSTSLLRATLEATADGILVTDLTGRIVTFNRRFVEMWRIPDSVLASRDNSMALEFVLSQLKDADSFLKRVAELYDNVELEGYDVLEFKDGRVFERYSHPQKVAGRNVGRVLSFRDITEKRRAEEALRRSEQNYRSLIENATHGIYRSTLDGRFLYVNPAMVTMLGYESDADLLGSNMGTDVYRDPKDRARLVDRFRHGGVVRSAEVQWKRKDGSPLIAHLSGRAVSDPRVPGGLYFEMFVEDITERRRLEEQLRQSQKMEAIGRLAGGVAHDFNNLLTAIAGYCDFLMSDLPKEDPRHGYAEEINKAAERATLLTRQLLAFSRKQGVSPRLLDLNSVVSTLEKMLRRVIGEDVRFVTVAAGDLGPVYADPGLMEQVLINLAVNACDAMPNGGTLTIETANVVLDEHRARALSGIAPGPAVMLSVTDTGTGIEEAAVGHIFEPFFTTKEVGQGTGLGLPTVYGIVRQAGGAVEFETLPGRGTTFRMFLPRAEEPAPIKRPREAPGAPVAGSETVLLVEDEELLRPMVSKFLVKSGYTVLEASNGIEAIELCEQHTGPIHLLLTDVVMPGMNGRDLADAVRPLRPGIKAMFVSGHTERAFGAHGIVEEGEVFLQKPFDMGTLLRKVRDCLDATAMPRP